jgi:hypothetical protein
LAGAAAGGAAKKYTAVRIPLNWGNKFWIEYDNGEIVRYGRGSNLKPPAGAKPLWYLIEPVMDTEPVKEVDPESVPVTGFEPLPEPDGGING